MDGVGVMTGGGGGEEGVIVMAVGAVEVIGATEVEGVVEGVAGVVRWK